MENKILNKSLNQLALALFITFITGFIVSNNSELLYNLSKYYILFIILSLGLALVMSLALKKLSPIIMKILFITFSIIEGFNFGVIFYRYKVSSIINIFLITSVILIVMSIIATKTKRNLNSLGTYLSVALFALIGAVITNLFMQSNSFELVISVTGVVIFTLYILYDVNMIKNNYPELIKLGYNENTLATYGAFNIYLDFINLFIDLLRLLGEDN